MITNSSRALGIALATVGLMLAGCRCQCKQNEQAGIGHIKCQPMDVTTNQNAKAVFEVQLDEKEANYQWFTTNGPVGAYTEGGRSSRLTVEVRPETEGDYWCEIDEDWGYPVRIRTRLAKLSLNSPNSAFGVKGVRGQLSLMGTNIIILDIPPTPGFPPTTSVSGTICSNVSYGTYVIYPYWLPDANTTKYVAKVRFASSNNPPSANTNYELRRTSSLTDRVCATNMGTIQKSQSCSGAVQHKFTVYLKPEFCFSTNYPVYLEVDWQ